jgi:hypothetical protein
MCFPSGKAVGSCEGDVGLHFRMKSGDRNGGFPHFSVYSALVHVMWKILVPFYLYISMFIRHRNALPHSTQNKILNSFILVKLPEAIKTYITIKN